MIMERWFNSKRVPSNSVTVGNYLSFGGLLQDTISVFAADIAVSYTHLDVYKRQVKVSEK